MLCLETLSRIEPWSAACYAVALPLRYGCYMCLLRKKFSNMSAGEEGKSRRNYIRCFRNCLFCVLSLHAIVVFSHGIQISVPMHLLHYLEWVQPALQRRIEKILKQERGDFQYPEQIKDFGEVLQWSAGLFLGPDACGLCLQHSFLIWKSKTTKKSLKNQLLIHLKIDKYSSK